MNSFINSIEYKIIILLNQDSDYAFNVCVILKIADE